MNALKLQFMKTNIWFFEYLHSTNANIVNGIYNN